MQWSICDFGWNGCFTSNHWEVFMKTAVLKIPASIFLEISEIIFQSSYFLEYRKILFIQLPVYKPPEYTNIWPQVYNPINIPNISLPPPCLFRIYALSNIGQLNLSSLLNIKFIKSISMYFASAIYLASFFTNESFIEIDSSRHKASDHQINKQQPKPAITWLKSTIKTL